MKNKELFNRTVDILVKAYRNDTLQHMNCYACAIGNLVAHGMNYEYNKDNDFKYYQNAYFHFFYLLRNSEEGNKELGRQQIESTGYTIEELNKIERAFERSDRGNSGDDWMLNGLLAVYDTLCEIHEVNKEEVTKGELVFVKEA